MGKLDRSYIAVLTLTQRQHYWRNNHYDAEPSISTALAVLLDMKIERRLLLGSRVYEVHGVINKDFDYRAQKFFEGCYCFPIFEVDASII